MLIRRSRPIGSSEVTPRRLYLRRREFLQACGVAAAAAFAIEPRAFAQQRRRLDVATRMATTTDALTPYRDVTTYNNFYEFGVDKEDPSSHAAAFNSTPWTVDVDGECAKPGRFALDDILKPHGLEERIYRHRCVEGWSMVIPWIGVPLGDVLKRFEPNSNAHFVQFASTASTRT